jgi:hypothetical protein
MQDLIAQRDHLQGELHVQRGRDKVTAVANTAIGAAAAGSPIALGLAAGTATSERARLLVQIAAQEAKLRDLGISLQTNEDHVNGLKLAKSEVFQKQDEFAEVMGAVSRAKQRYEQIEQTLASLEPAIKAIEQDRLLKFDEGAAAAGSSRPIAPKATTVVLLALLAGVATGILFLILAEVFDHVYRSSSQVARSLGLPILESIDEIVTAEDRRCRFLSGAVLSPLVVVCFLGLAGVTGSMAYLSIEQPSTYQRLRRIPEAAIRLFAEQPSPPTDSRPDAGG